MFSLRNGETESAEQSFGDDPKNSMENQSKEDIMVHYLEGVLKYNYVSGWKHTLEKLRVFFDTASMVDRKEKTSEVDWKVDFKEKIGGWWW